MLITCSECSHEVSDKALACPNCGNPIRNQLTISKPRKSSNTKRMRLPNGFGRITKIKGKNLRKPYRVMITDGKDDNGKPIGRLLKPESYFETYNEAYTALVHYHESPYDLSSMITMQELFEQWFKTHSEKVCESRKRIIKTAWEYCDPLLGDKLVQTIKTKDISYALDNLHKNEGGNKVFPSDNIRLCSKSVLSMMLDYAVEYGLTDQNYARKIKRSFSCETEKHHICYAKEEIEILWEHVGEDYCIDMILVQCYMGWRPNEICKISLSNVNLRDWTIISGSKTAAGKNREVPVHSKIRPIIQRWYNDSLKYNGKTLFFNRAYKPISYSTLSQKFAGTLKKLKLNKAHRPHDGRTHFVTMAKEANVDEYAIKLIVGHSISDLTERVYTQRNIEWLHKEIAKIS